MTKISRVEMHIDRDELVRVAFVRGKVYRFYNTREQDGDRLAELQRKFSRIRFSTIIIFEVKK